MTNTEFSHKLDVMWEFLERSTAGMQNDKRAIKKLEKIQSLIVDLDILIMRHEPSAKKRKAQLLQKCS
jgi:hypothetical protein